MMTLPLVLNGSHCVFIIIGGGQVAARKVRTLVASGASVTVIAPSVTDDIQVLASEGKLTLELRPAGTDEIYQAGSYVVLATDDEQVNALQAQRARQAGALVCRTDEPDGNDFIFPAVVDRSPLTVAISTSGATPALTRSVRERIEAFLPQDYSILARWMEDLRSRLRSEGSQHDRANFWRQWMRSQAPEQILARRPDIAQAITDDLLSGKEPDRGEVFLVGAGPGDPDLLTFRALRLIQMADVVFYDRLVGERIIDLLPAAAEKFYVGKARSDHAVPQDDINQLLVDEALKGKRVLRLKGGDPFIFGRGGEEIEQISASGIPFQVVPGITAASGCASYAGIPLTHRDHAQSVRFVTGHLRNGTCNLPWNELIHPSQTLVIYMGLVGLPYICEQLIAHGMPADTPVALVEKGTLPDQKVHTGTLASMPGYVEGREIHAPTLTIVGSVVTLREKLSWR
ncbi:MAG TPA: uroporphyrinogen-III C-methyltransferase [Oceanospirillales bacterium]|nr:uroporphyrinogen-III C-methyltransferase [Oceanospirillaceae bacterium]HBS42979.1 uroporphyrinogen-III C-methyltransferase [Oceanospirillales bacterium]|tara:strand:- start:2164 stop:3534 length:1371 start_codon:yes stop_codon:yes gene_type:complete